MASSEPDDATSAKRAEKSFGNMSDAHWSRARAGTNEEALEYYRERSHAPGVEAGGGARNFYCMKCDGVIPHEPPPTECPHCGETTAEAAKRYFNWVEINEPPRSDARAVLLPVVVGLAGAAVVGFVAWWFLR